LNQDSLRILFELLVSGIWHLGGDSRKASLFSKVAFNFFSPLRETLFFEKFTLLGTLLLDRFSTGQSLKSLLDLFEAL